MDVRSRTAQVCIAGTQAEYERRLDDARRLYREAWDAATDDYDACIAAHYIAHLEPEPARALRWNLEALTHAQRVPDRAAEFMASLYVNLGRSYELVGDLPEAERYYGLAAELGLVHRSE
jgi:tetratricopeptide (TPR) repeat protein